MHFESRIVRPPFEAKSVFLQVTKGCSHNKCIFCSYYKDIEYEISSIEEIESDLRELKEKSNSFKRIWLQSADPFGLDTEYLCQIANLIHSYLPFVQSIGGYVRVDSIKEKSVDDLIKLKDCGYNSIVFGVESADDNLLRLMNKGYTSSDILKQITKMDKAGLSYTLIFLNAMGGHDYSESHAIETANIFNQFKPERVMINSLRIYDNTELSVNNDSKRFVEADSTERVKELIIFLENLNIDTFIDATNSTNEIKFFGYIQANKKIMIERLKSLS